MRFGSRKLASKLATRLVREERREFILRKTKKFLFSLQLIETYSTETLVPVRNHPIDAANGYFSGTLNLKGEAEPEF